MSLVTSESVKYMVTKKQNIKFNKKYKYNNCNVY